jgi:hypothetical protein
MCQQGRAGVAWHTRVKSGACLMHALLLLGDTWTSLTCEAS